MKVSSARLLYRGLHVALLVLSMVGLGCACGQVGGANQRVRMTRIQHRDPTALERVASTNVVIHAVGGATLGDAFDGNASLDIVLFRKGDGADTKEAAVGGGFGFADRDVTTISYQDVPDGHYSVKFAVTHFMPPTGDGNLDVGSLLIRDASADVEISATTQVQELTLELSEDALREAVEAIKAGRFDSRRTVTGYE